MKKQAIAERRSETRSPAEAWEQTTINVWVSPMKQVAAMIADMSRSGLGIVVQHAVGFEPGYQVKVDFLGVLRIATVAHVTPTDGGEIVVGLKWNKDFN